MDAMSGLDPAARITAWLGALGSALAAGRAEAAAALFAPECYWRDLLAFTWNVKTMEGRAAIRLMLEATAGAARAARFALDGPAWEAEGRIEAFLTVETAAGRGRGHLRLGADGAYTLLTTLESLRGHEEAAGPRRPLGTTHGAIPGRRTWADCRREEEEGFGRHRQPHCVIVGGGQGGIALGARLRRLGVPALIVERNPRPGDSWRNRYRTLVLHDPVWYDHMPYLPYPDDWPVFCPKDRMGDWLESYVRIMDVPYWGGTECVGAAWDPARREWAVRVRRAGEEITLRPKALVLATGFYGPPHVPDIPGAAGFRGTVLHSARWQDGRLFAGRRAVVVGSNTSAHDICQDLWESGADVTMVQRSSSLVVRSETFTELGFGPLWSEAALAAGITTDKADLLFASVPFALAAERAKPAAAAMAARDADLIARLNAVGFRTDLGHDGSGLLLKALRTGSGYYIDVGCSELIADGRVRLRSQVEPVAFAADGLTLSDGSHLPADLVVWATGYQTVQASIASLLGPETAARIGHCWGYGSGTPGDPGPWEGEMRNLWKPVAQEGLWLHGGNLHLSRFFSAFVALQIAARMHGLPTPVYGGPVPAG
jgi:putative flavoprotein involved in K+ transport